MLCKRISHLHRIIRTGINKPSKRIHRPWYYCFRILFHTENEKFYSVWRFYKLLRDPNPMVEKGRNQVTKNQRFGSRITYGNNLKGILVLFPILSVNKQHIGLEEKKRSIELPMFIVADADGQTLLPGIAARHRWRRNGWRSTIHRKIRRQHLCSRRAGPLHDARSSVVAST